MADFRNSRAFTLLEMAVVIVIISLLIGGVLVGQTLKRSSQLRGIILDAQSYAASISQFQDKFGYLPGDMPTATRVWGRVGGGTGDCANSATDVSVGKTTCNGDGNGLIDGVQSEEFRAWQQLVAAEFISGSYTGVQGSGGVAHTIVGVNAPAGPFGNTGFFLWSWGYKDSSDPTLFEGDYNNTMVFGGETPANYPSLPVLAGAEANSIDLKNDDGLPATGSVRGPKNIAACSGGVNNSYITTGSDPVCILFFMNTFGKKAQ